MNLLKQVGTQTDSILEETPHCSISQTETTVAFPLSSAQLAVRVDSVAALTKMRCGKFATCTQFCEQKT